MQVRSLVRALEKGMATHSSILVWRIPWTEEPGGLQSTGRQRVRHDWSDLAHTEGVCGNGRTVGAHSPASGSAAQGSASKPHVSAVNTIANGQFETELNL